MNQPSPPDRGASRSRTPPWITAAATATMLLCTLLALSSLLHTHAQLLSVPLSSSYDCTLASGRAGNALRVQDQHQYLVSRPIPHFPGAANSLGLAQFTIAFWMQQYIKAKHPHLALYELPPTFVGDQALFGLYRYAVLSMDVGGQSTQSSINADMISDGGWHHVAISWDGTAGGITHWYVDGILETTTFVSPGYVFPTQGVISLGQGRYVGAFLGQLDEWLWFGSVLSDADRMMLTQASPSSPVDAQLASAGVFTRNNAITVYSFNQPQTLSGVETVTDCSGQGNDATIVCSTNCWPEAVVPSTAPTFSTGAKTVLMPVTGAQADYTLQLVQTSSSDPFAGSALTITALPSSGFATLYRVHPTDPTQVGAALAVNDVVQASEMNAGVGEFIAVILRLSAAFDFSASTSFTYSFTPTAPGSTQIPSRIDIGPNHAPDFRPPPGYSSVLASVLPDETEYVRTIDVDEGASIDVFPVWRRYPSVEHYAADRDADTVQVWVIAVPLEGRLFHNRTDSTDGLPINAASTAAPVLLRGLTLTFQAPVARPTLPLLNVTFLLSDGHQWAVHTSALQFRVKALPHLALVTPVNASVLQDQATLIQLDIDATPLAAFDLPFISIESLPRYGSLRQYNPDGSIGVEMGVESDPTTHRSPATISQYLTRVIGFSSFYPDAHGSWNASQLLGPPDAFPSYGDDPKAWAGEFANHAEWLELGFDIPVYITAIEIFETYNPGHISDIFARSPVTQEWVQIFRNNNLEPAEPAPDAKANVMSPVLCPMNFATDAIRVEVQPAGQTWVELDAIRIIGTTRTSMLSVADLNHRLWYLAPRLKRGEDAFTYTVNSCRYFSLYRQIGVPMHSMSLALVPVNHPPVAANLSVTTGPMGDVALASLQGQDPDLGDSIHFRILSLPSRGTLYVRPQANEPVRGLSPSDLPFTIPADSDLRFEAKEDDRCDFDKESDFANDWVQYQAVDAGSPQLSSEVVSLQLRVYCIRVQTFPYAIVASIFFFMCFGILSCVILAAFLWRHREESVVKASSVMFILFSILGCALLYLSLLPLTRSNLSPAWCMLRWVLPCLGFTLLFGSIFVKTYRVYRIVRNKSFTDVALSNETLGKFVGCMLMACSTVLLVYGVVDPPKPSFQYRFDDRHTVLTGCSTNNVFRGLLLGGLGLLTAWGTWLTICVRNVSERFNEGSYLAVSIYNAFLVGGLGIALDFVLDGNPTGQLVIRAFLIIVGLAVCVSALYITKVVRLCQHFFLAYIASSQVTERRRKLMQRVYGAAIKAGHTDAEAHALAMAEVERHPSLYISSVVSSPTPKVDRTPVLHTRVGSVPTTAEVMKERAQLLPAAFGGSLLAPETGTGLQARRRPKPDRAVSMLPPPHGAPRKPPTPRAKSHSARVGMNASAAAAAGAGSRGGGGGPSQPVCLPPLDGHNEVASLSSHPLTTTPSMLPAVLEANIDGHNDEMFFAAAAAATPRIRKHSRTSPAQLYAAAQMQLLHAGIRPNFAPCSDSSQSSSSGSLVGTPTPPSTSSLLSSPLAMVARLPPAQLMQWQSSLNRLIALSTMGSHFTTATPTVTSGTTTTLASPVVPVRPLPPLSPLGGPVSAAPLSQSPLTTGAQTQPPTPLPTPEQLVHAALLESTPKPTTVALVSRSAAAPLPVEPYPHSQWSDDAGAASPTAPATSSVAADHPQDGSSSSVQTPDSQKRSNAQLLGRLASLQSLDPHSKPIRGESGADASSASWLQSHDDTHALSGDLGPDLLSHDHGHGILVTSDHRDRGFTTCSTVALGHSSHDGSSMELMPASQSGSSPVRSSGSSAVTPESVSIEMQRQRAQRAMEERIVQVHFEPAVDEALFDER